MVKQSLASVLWPWGLSGGLWALGNGIENISGKSLRWLRALTFYLNFKRCPHGSTVLGFDKPICSQPVRSLHSPINLEHIPLKEFLVCPIWWNNSYLWNYVNLLFSLANSIKLNRIILLSLLRNHQCSLYSVCPGLRPIPVHLLFLFPPVPHPLALLSIPPVPTLVRHLT